MQLLLNSSSVHCHLLPDGELAYFVPTDFFWQIQTILFSLYIQDKSGDLFLINANDKVNPVDGLRPHGVW
ncbi:hypothetical protein EL17_18475 [Anditalea andensis]|uniref:Uncharacterized protein n=1 Tax=Anditalea andensis TaxID=1048983 RepID=A0A074KYN3_9BACT|nr:hypothetical protein EL17_18475 [Anditalea andensis]